MERCDGNLRARRTVKHLRLSAAVISLMTCTAKCSQKSTASAAVAYRHSVSSSTAGTPAAHGAGATTDQYNKQRAMRMHHEQSVSGPRTGVDGQQRVGDSDDERQQHRAQRRVRVVAQVRQHQLANHVTEQKALRKKTRTGWLTTETAQRGIGRTWPKRKMRGWREKMDVGESAAHAMLSAPCAQAQQARLRSSDRFETEAQARTCTAKGSRTTTGEGAGCL